MIEIRHAEVADIPDMVALHWASDTAPHWSLEQFGAMFATADHPDPVPRLMLVAIVASEISGFLVARSVVGEWELESIVVAEPNRRQGVGSALMTALLEQVNREAGIGVWLEVRESNQSACKLYERWGFMAVGQRHSYYSQPVEDAILYAWKPSL